MKDLPQTVQQKRDEFLNGNGRYRVYDINPKNHNSLNFIDASRILGNTRLTLDDKLPNEKYTEVKENGSIYKLMYLSNPNNPSIKALEIIEEDNSYKFIQGTLYLTDQSGLAKIVTRGLPKAKENYHGLNIELKIPIEVTFSGYYQQP